MAPWKFQAWRFTRFSPVSTVPPSFAIDLDVPPGKLTHCLLELLMSFSTSAIHFRFSEPVDAATSRSHATQPFAEHSALPAALGTTQNLSHVNFVAHAFEHPNWENLKTTPSAAPVLSARLSFHSSTPNPEAHADGLRENVHTPLLMGAKTDLFSGNGGIPWEPIHVAAKGGFLPGLFRFAKKTNIPLSKGQITALSEVGIQGAGKKLSKASELAHKFPTTVTEKVVAARVRRIDSYIQEARSVSRSIVFEKQPATSEQTKALIQYIEALNTAQISLIKNSDTFFKLK